MMFKILQNSKGFSFIELAVVLGLGSVLLGTAALNVRVLDSPVLNAQAATMGFMKQVRARAVATTNAYRVSALSPTVIMTRYGDNCADNSMTIEPQTILELPATVTMTNITWDVCFDTRGMADQSIEISLQSAEGKIKSVEVFAGGAIMEK